VRRGDIIVAVGRGDFSTKPRPSLIVQADPFAEHHPTITVCPITTEVRGGTFYRVPIAADADTNLVADSEVEIDLLQAIRRERVGRLIGSASNNTMTLVDQALRRWVDL
jgi:mRNA interferase MazF